MPEADQPDADLTRQAPMGDGQPGAGQTLGPPPTAADAAAWEALYQQGEDGWDLGNPSPPLQAAQAAGELPTGRRVLVPGCGRGHDLVYLARRGYQVTGCDIAPSAIAAAGERCRSLDRRVRLICGDALGDELPVASFDWIFDQTFLCALFPDQRCRYPQQMRRLLQSDGQLWVLNVRTPHRDRQPYDLAPALVIELLAEAGLQLLWQRPLTTESHPRRRGRERWLVFGR